MASVKELKSTMILVANALRSYDTFSDEQFPKLFGGVTKQQALLNMAKILEEAATSGK